MEDKITVTEFCKKRSLNDKRVELIGGFHAWMIGKGVVKATEQEIEKQFNEFCSMPA